MIRRRMQEATLMKLAKTQDIYGTKKGYTEAGTIQVSLSLNDGATQSSSDIRFINASHIGLTNDSGIAVDDKLTLEGVDYRVDYIDHSGRWTRLWLNVVSEVQNG